MAQTSGRLQAPPLPHLAAHKEVVVPQTACAMHDFDIAHTIMLVETGIVPEQVGVPLLRALAEIPCDEVLKLRSEVGGGNHAGERLVTRSLGQSIGGYLGLARSSGDLSAVSIRLYLRAAILAVGSGLESLRQALLDFAAEHAGTVMAGATHGQHAQPTTLGHWALMFEAHFARDTERLAVLFGRVNLSPAGAGIMTGTELPIDRARVAELLGFDGVHDNTMDAILSHDIELEFAATLLLQCQGLARLADDLMLWSTFEHRTIVLPDWFCGTSSLMPQKKNPDGLEDAKSLAAEALALVTLIGAIERGPTGYTIIERRTSDTALRELVDRLIERLPALARLFPQITVDRERMERLAGSNWAQASDLATLLVRRQQVDWRTAHQLIADLIRHCVTHAISPTDVTLTLLRERARAAGTAVDRISATDFAAALDVRQFVDRRPMPGGPSPAQVQVSIVMARDRLEQARGARSAILGRLARSQKRLTEAVRKISGIELESPQPRRTPKE